MREVSEFARIYDLLCDEQAKNDKLRARVKELEEFMTKVAKDGCVWCLVEQEPCAEQDVTPCTSCAARRLMGGKP